MKLFLKMKKITIALAVAFVITTIISPLAFAQENEGEILRSMGILKGNLQGDLMLDEFLNRQDSIVLLSRLLGKEDEAKNHEPTTTFEDIPDPLYIPYISWAQAEGLTVGISESEFGFGQVLERRQLLTFLLRAMEYEITLENYGEVEVIAEKARITDERHRGQSMHHLKASRGFMAEVTYNALEMGRTKYSNITLKKSLFLNNESTNSSFQFFNMESAEFKDNIMIVSMTSFSSDMEDGLISYIFNTGPDVNDFQLILSQGDEETIIDLKHFLWDKNDMKLHLIATLPDSIEDGSLQLSYFEDKDGLIREVEEGFGGSDAPESVKSNPLYQDKGLSGNNPLYEKVVNSLINSSEGILSVDIAGYQDGNDLTLRKRPGRKKYSVNILDDDSDGDGIDDATEADARLSIDFDGDDVNLDNIHVFRLENGLRVRCPDGSCYSIVYQDGKAVITLKELDKASPKAMENTDILYYDEEELLRIISSHASLSKADSKRALESLVNGILNRTNKPYFANSVDLGFMYLFSIKDPEEISCHIKLNAIFLEDTIINPDLKENEIKVLLNRDGNYLETIISLHDFSDDFEDLDSMLNNRRYYTGIDEDCDDADRLRTPYLNFNGSIIKPLDKASPLLFNLNPGDEIIIFEDSSGRQLFIEDNIDVESTSLYFNNFEFSDENTLKIGRNPQTGKEIKIAAKALVSVGSETMTKDEYTRNYGFKVEVSSVAQVIIYGDEVVYMKIFESPEFIVVEKTLVEDKEFTVVWGNLMDITKEEISILADASFLGTSRYVFTSQMGQIHATRSGGFISGGDLDGDGYGDAVIILASDNKTKFKAGAELSKKVNITNPTGNVGTSDPILNQLNLSADEIASFNMAIYLDEEINLYPNYEEVSIKPIRLELQ